MEEGHSRFRSVSNLRSALAEAQQAGGVDDDQHRPGVVDQGSHHRVQNAGDGQEDGRKIQGHGEGEIVFDGGHHAPGQAQQVGQLPQVVVHQGDVRRVHGDVAAHATHGDAHQGFFQSGGVVDAVAHHAHRVPRLLAAVDPIQLILRAAVGLVHWNVQVSGNGAGGVLVVPGEEHRSHPRRLHPPDGLRRLGAHLVA